jgi:hypothetical protein
MDSKAAGFLPLVTKASKKRSNNFAETLILVCNIYLISIKAFLKYKVYIKITHKIPIQILDHSGQCCLAHICNMCKGACFRFDLATDWKLCTVHSPSANCVKVIVYIYAHMRLVTQLVRNYVNLDIDILTV